MSDAISFWTARSKSSSCFLLSALRTAAKAASTLASKSGIAPTSAGAPWPPKAAQHSSRMISFLRASAATLASKARSSPSCGAALVVGGFLFLLLLLLALRPEPRADLLLVQGRRLAEVGLRAECHGLSFLGSLTSQ